MPNARDIRTRINSIRETRKITNAMYLISSTKMRKAKREWDQTRPYFTALQAEVKRIFRTAENVEMCIRDSFPARRCRFPPSKRCWTFPASSA